MEIKTDMLQFFVEYFDQIDYIEKKKKLAQFSLIKTI